MFGHDRPLELKPGGARLHVLWWEFPVSSKNKRGFGNMDGVSWSTSRSQESFSRTTPTAETLSRLASFIARSETRPHTQKQRQQPSHLPLYVCQECGKGFPYAADVLKHQELKHALPKPHRCPACGQTFSLKSSLQLHKCNQDSAQTECCCGLSRFGSPCPACMTRTSNPVRLQDNSLHRPPLLLDSSPYACALCGRSFSQKQALLHHQQAGCSRPSSPPKTADACSLPESPPVSEGDSVRSDASDNPGPSCRDTGVCQVCSRTFPTESALQRHKRVSHTGEKSGEGCGDGEVGGANGRLKSQKKLLSCRSCDMVFRCTAKLNMHRKEKHSREKKLREPRPVVLKRRKAGKYPCQVCNKVFFHHLSLRAHVRRHTASPFSSVNNGSHHEGRLSKEAEPSENTPNNVTITGSDEEEEEEQEKEFPCPSCAEVFSLQQLLKEHMELHQSSVRRRQCSVCTTEMDSCKSSGSRRQRLYHCVPCQQGFSALGSFLQHCQEHLRARVEEDQISASFTQQDRKA